LLTGILLSGAALAVWIVPGLRSGPAPTLTADLRLPETPTPSVPTNRSGGTDESMAAFFAAVPPRASEPSPTLESLAGAWTATIVSVDVEGDPAPIRDARGL